MTQASFARLERGAFLALLCVGLYATVLGPALPSFADRLGVPLDTAGLLVTALFAGSITASGALALRPLPRHSTALTVIGLLIIASGLTLLGMARGWWQAVGASVLLGVGDGLVVAATHTLIARVARDVPRGINRLNLFFAFGAIAGPLWFGFANEAGAGLPLIYVILALAPVLLAAQLLLAGGHRTRALNPPTTMAVRPLKSPPKLALLSALLFLYVGAEFGLGLWLATYTEQVAGAGRLAASIVTALYWFALALGRAASGRMFQRQRPAAEVLAWSVSGALVSSVALVVFGGSLAAGGLAAFATGFFFGPIWPATLSLASQGSPGGAAPARLVTVGNAGALLIPWLQGRLLVDAGPRQGIALTVALSAGMLALVVADMRPWSRLSRVSRPETETAGSDR